MEWNSTLFVNFVDFRNTVDSVHRERLWSIKLRNPKEDYHYGEVGLPKFQLLSGRWNKLQRENMETTGTDVRHWKI